MIPRNQKVRDEIAGLLYRLRNLSNREKLERRVFLAKEARAVSHPVTNHSKRIFLEKSPLKRGTKEVKSFPRTRVDVIQILKRKH